MRIYKTRYDFENLDQSEIFPGTICTITDEVDNPTYIYQNSIWNAFVTVPQSEEADPTDLYANTNTLDVARWNLAKNAIKSSSGELFAQNRNDSPLRAVNGYPVTVGTVIDDGTGSYTAASDWTGNTVANDTNYSRLGTSCTKMHVTGTPGTYVRITKDYGSPSFTIASGDKVTLWVYCPSAESNGVSLYVSPDGTWTNHFYISYAGGKLRKGWNGITFLTADFTTVGSPSWGALQQFRVVFSCTNAAYPTIYYGGLAVNSLARPKVIIGFDDGFASVKNNALPILREFGLVAYESIIGKLIGQTNYLTAAEITELYDLGWDILVHGPAPGAIDNLYDWDTQAEMQADVEYNRDLLLANGWLRGNDIYIYPQGVWMESGSPGNTDAMDAVIAAGMRAACIFNNGTLGSGDGDSTIGGLGIKHLIRRQNIGTNTVATLLANLDIAISKGRTYHIAGHDILATNNPGGTGASPPADGNTYYLDDFRALCAGIAARIRQGKVDNVGICQFVDDCAIGY